MENLQALARAIDYGHLRTQKRALLDALDKIPHNPEHLQGLLHLLDAFQDAVVADGLVPELEVFPDIGAA